VIPAVVIDTTTKSSAYRPIQDSIAMEQRMQIKELKEQIEKQKK
jgi:hypothetical protein